MDNDVEIYLPMKFTFLSLSLSIHTHTLPMHSWHLFTFSVFNFFFSHFVHAFVLKISNNNRKRLLLYRQSIGNGCVDLALSLSRVCSLRAEKREYSEIQTKSTNEVSMVCRKTKNRPSRYMTRDTAIILFSHDKFDISHTAYACPFSLANTEINKNSFNLSALVASPTPDVSITCGNWAHTNWRDHI